MAHKKSKHDIADEKRRAKSLKQTTQNITALFDSILRDNYQRLADIPASEWQEALEADAAEVTTNA